MKSCPQSTDAHQFIGTAQAQYRRPSYIPAAVDFAPETLYTSRQAVSFRVSRLMAAQLGLSCSSAS